MNNELYKIVVYNYLYKFSKVETLLKERFEEILKEVSNDEVRNKFIFLHLAEEIKSKFEEDLQTSGFRIRRLHYKNSIDSIKWNLKKRIEFAKKNDLMNEVLSDVKLFQKRETIQVDKIIKDAIKIRNCLAHETFNIDLDSRLELLSDEKLRDLVEEDCEFASCSGLTELESKYKHALTYYFYLKEIENQLIL